MFLLLLVLQHHHQVGILVFQEVKQEGHEVVDDVGLVTLPARVHVYSYTGIFQCDPLRVEKKREKKRESTQ